ncbi:DMT family transporter [Photobacterium angustum]|uniref:DMT family transporter n=1 Tax=Photobacterium angustum TaxID=661 RepID=UPI0005D37845|nr:EamA family transporter [Photobacterium angustum]KJF82563.1 permease of the drug/metabolite transporter (DMT) superfamily [Photobacterium damselae subsp. damselae]KJG41945.1 permease of the drug/metabolite transporter (DMT) superfamily [Photobacterium angustum]KJG46546.1 permease of the drug/metabolite transporter (DMT) superfamily [Photobacterium angustum]KJG50693.1 permease of the drug/metabolite transporter (DMT) superfamily [Photobacterium angustum]KJG54561.1 permease of the drug/metabo
MTSSNSNNNPVNESVSSPHAELNKGIVYALIGTALFSIKPVFIKLAYQYGGDAVSIMSLRAISSVPIYIVMMMWLLRKIEHRDNLKRYGLTASAIGVLGYYVASYLDIAAMAHISAQLERLLIFLFPSFVVLISWLVLKQKPAQGTFKAIALGYIGVAFIVFHDLGSMGNNVLLGSGLAIASAFVFACYLIMSKKLITQMGGQLFTCIGMGSAGIIILIQSQWQGVNVIDLDPMLILLGIALGIFCTVLPSFFVAAAMQKLNPSLLSLTSNVGPAITSVFAITLLNEPFTFYHAIGMLFVVYSVISMKKKGQ